MKKFFISILFVILGCFAVDRLGGIVMFWINQHTRDVSGPKIKYLFNDVHEDILFMGTSRCNYHYVPSVIRDSLGTSVYNGGIDASSNIFAHYIVLNHVLSIYKPKVICLEVMINDFNVQDDPYKTITFFAPYFGNNAKADSVFLLAGKFWRYRFSHLLRYNARAASNIVGLFVDRQKKADCGYLPNPKPKQYPQKLENEITPSVIDSVKIEYLQRFINLCLENNIRLIFVVSPRFTKVESGRYDVIKTMANKNGIPFLDYHTIGLFHDHPDFFRDKSHLWDKGARLYSSIFAHDLKNILNHCSPINIEDRKNRFVSN